MVLWLNQSASKLLLCRGGIMNKKLSPLEALEKLNHTICLNINNKTLTFGIDKYDDCDCKDIYEFSKCYDIIEKALKNYQELLERPYVLVVGTHGHAQALIDKLNNYKDIKIANIEDGNKLKALEIIKNKDVNPIDIRCCDTIEQYNVKENGNVPLIQEEFDLLKEVLL